MNKPIGIILAAGRGSRMKEHTNKIPKGLIEFREKPLISYTLDNFIENGITDISIVVGYKKDALISFVKKNYSKLNVKFIENKEWNNSNSGMSLRMALHNSDISSGYLLAESDLYWEKVNIPFKESIAFVGQLANRKGSTLNENNTLGHSSDIDAKYKTINIYYFDSKDAEASKKLLTKKFDNEYYESSWYGKIKFKPFYMNNWQWGEFDSFDEFETFEKQPKPIKLIDGNYDDDTAFSDINFQDTKENILFHENWVLAKIRLDQLIPSEKTSSTILKSMKYSIDTSNALLKPVMIYSNSRIHIDKKKHDILIEEGQLFVLDGHHRLRTFVDNGYKYIYVAITDKKLKTASIDRIVNPKYLEKVKRIANNNHGIKAYKEVNDFFRSINVSINRNYDIVNYSYLKDSVNNLVKMPKISFDEFFSFVLKNGVSPIKTIYFYPKPNKIKKAWVYKH